MKKEIIFVCMLALSIVIIGCGSDSGGGGKKVTDKLELTATSLGGDTYSLSGGIGYISFRVGVIKGGAPVHLNSGDLTWSYTGPDLGVLDPVPGTPSGATFTPNGTTGTITVKAEYDGLWSELTINIVA